MKIKNTSYTQKDDSVGDTSKAYEKREDANI